MNIKKSAFSLLELVIAIGISVIVVSTALMTIGNIYMSQHKVAVTQDFYAESRFLMERVVQIVRNNTIDYDRFFIEVGPSLVDCPSFHGDQVGGGLTTNDSANRETLGYSNIFYWELDNGDIRNMGGIKKDGTTEDSCTKVWDAATLGTDPIKILYLINAERTVQTAIKYDDVDFKIEIERRLGADTDNDGKIDLWSAVSTWDDATSICEIEDTTPTSWAVSGITTEDDCNLAHVSTVISPVALEITDLSFVPSPDRDPFLNFRISEAQIHPHVFVSMGLELRNPPSFGITDSFPNVLLQTAASSRVFGNSRK